MSAKIRLENIDSELMIKNYHLKIGTKSLTTPEVSSNVSPISDINEMFKRFTLDKPRSIQLDQILNSDAYEAKVNRDLHRLLQTKLNVFIVEYADNKIPETKHLEALSDIQYPYTDIVTTPIFSDFFRNDELTGDKLIETFVDLTNTYLDIVETLNDKAILGVIPIKAPRLSLAPILKNYYDRDITSFILDFDGRAADTSLSKVRMMMRLMNEYGILENALLYGVNSNAGKFMKGAMEVPAKDFISMGFGVDIIGRNHVPPRMPNYAWSKIAAQRRTFRIFNRDTYGYSKIADSDLMQLGIQSKSKMTTYTKNYNITEQYKEALELKNLLTAQPTLEPYLSSKSQVTDPIIDKIKKLRKHAYKT